MNGPASTQRSVRDLAAVLRLAADDLDRLADDLPELSEADALRRANDCIELTRSAIRNIGPVPGDP